MKFKVQSTYNQKDTVSKTIDGRMTIKHNVAYRCERVLVAIVGKGTDGIALNQLVEVINKRLKSSYTRNDIRYAVSRLLKQQLISSDAGKYCANSKALEQWKKEPTEWV